MRLAQKITVGIATLGTAFACAPVAQAVVVDELPPRGLIETGDTWHTAYQEREYIDGTDAKIVPVYPYFNTNIKCEIINPGGFTGTCWQQRSDGTWISLVGIPVADGSIQVYPVWED